MLLNSNWRWANFRTNNSWNFNAISTLFFKGSRSNIRHSNLYEGFDKNDKLELIGIWIVDDGKFVVNPGNFSFNLMVPIDIVIGTVPLRSSFPSFLPSNTSLLTVQQDPINVTHGTSLLTLDKYPDLRESILNQFTLTDWYNSTVMFSRSFLSSWELWETISGLFLLSLGIHPHFKILKIAFSVIV